MTDLIAPPDHVHLRIVSPEQVLVEAEARWVQIPLVDGLIGVWPGHSALLGALGEGVIQYALPKGVEELPVRGGILRITGERCVVLVSQVGPKKPAPEPVDQGNRLFDELTEAIENSVPSDQLRELQEG